MKIIIYLILKKQGKEMKIQQHMHLMFVVIVVIQFGHTTKVDHMHK
jgi:hypothetical protein